MSIEIRYEVYDRKGLVGSVSGSELRKHFGYGRHDHVFNDDLVNRWNADKVAINSDEFMHVAVFKNGKRVGAKPNNG